MHVVRIIAVAVLIGLCARAPAAATGNETLRAQIQETVSKLEVAIEKGVSAEELTQLMYMPDTLVTGEGVAKARHGIAAETVAIDGFLHSLAKPGARRCHFALLDPVALSDHVISAFSNLTCRPASADDPAHATDLMEYHILYVWKRSSSGWKVALEMFAGKKM